MAAADVQVTFTGDFGDLPALVPASVDLDDGSGTVDVSEVVAGTKQSLVCSGRGKCSACPLPPVPSLRRACVQAHTTLPPSPTSADTKTGLCECFDGYTSSDGTGASGTRNDCGAVLEWSPS